MIPFLTAKNLIEPTLVEAQPWDFNVAEHPLRKLPKAARRAKLLQPSTAWQVYTAVRGFAASQRISKTNPPAALRGLVVDYDMVSDIDTVCGYVGQMAESLRPQFIEVSLSKKIRLIWVFDREVMVPSMAFCTALIESFFAKLGVPTLLAGYDANSTKPTEMWTNGGEWYSVNEHPMAWEYVFGVYCDTSKKASLFNKGEIAIDVIAKEIEKRYPGKWAGDFRLDALGVRFWEAAADNATGCQIKPDGMLCFTGNIAFMRWADILGTSWVEEQRVLNLGRAGEGLFFDGRAYWEAASGRWVTLQRVDAILRLKNAGLSDKTPKGMTASDVDRVLNHVQMANRVDGAAPLINYAPGIVDLQGRRILNISNLQILQPVAGTGTPETDFPWVWTFLNGMFARPEGKPLDHFLAWARRGYRNMLFNERLMGQALFLCGPKNNGKTLLNLKIFAPLVGNRWANPIAYFTGQTNFNDDLFSAPLLAMNDEDGPGNESSKLRMQQKIKSAVVNPTHSYHAKFSSPVTIDWTGRIFATLNDDPASVSLLPEVNPNTRDKMMFFASQKYADTFPERSVLEARIAKELPLFAHWLLSIYQPPEGIVSDDRCGVKSYFDPVILELSNQQSYAFNLREILQKWIECAAYWGEEQKNKTWAGTPTSLQVELCECSPLAGPMREWTVQKVARSLVALARIEDSGVTISGDGGREFTIIP